MEDNLRVFLDKFAEVERRVRKMAAEDRALRNEVSELREKLAEAMAETDRARAELAEEQKTRESVKERLDRLIARIETVKQDGGPAGFIGAAPGLEGDEAEAEIDG